MKGVSGPWAMAILAVIAVTGAAWAAGPAANGRILVVASADRFSGPDLFTVNPDGTGRVRLTLDGRNASPVFSPNGERVAFLKSDGSSPRDLYVMNADGSGGARLLATHPEVTNAGGIRGIAWSPDSSRLAYALAGSPPIRVIDARDGTQFPLAQEGDPLPAFTLEWSPDGSELLYDDARDLWVKPLDGRPARRVIALDGQDDRASWSPDGGRIAFLHVDQAETGVFVMNRDGTGQRRVGVTPTNQLTGAPRWTSDGTAVLFGGLAAVRPGGFRGTGIAVSGVWVASADGSGQRLLREHVALPRPAPDGSRLLLGQTYHVAPAGYEVASGGVYTMNADGSCLTLVTSGAAVDWQRLPGGSKDPARGCVDLVVSAKAPEVEGLRGVSYSLVLQNRGTQTTTGARLVARFDADVRILIGRSSQRFCASSGSVVTCRAERMEPHQTLAVAVLARPRRAVPLRVEASAASDVVDSDPASNQFALSTRIYPCWIAGTDFNDRLQGTRAGEQICARAGDDVVRALGGSDDVDGGRGRDTIVGGSGGDRLAGGPGDDVLLARDGERDLIECGRGEDTASVDRLDVVRLGCEHVARPSR